MPVTDLRSLPELAGRIDHQRAKLLRAFDQAGSNFDISKVTEFDGPPAAKLDQLRALDRELGTLQDLVEARLDLVSTDGASESPRRAPRKTIGERFVESDAYKRRGNRTTAEIQVQPGEFGIGTKSLLTTFDPGYLSFPGSGIIAQIGQQPPTLAEAIPTVPWAHYRTRYLEEFVATNAAAPVAEGDLAAESALDLVEIDRLLSKIRTLLPVTDELLEDEATSATYLSQRLGGFVLDEVDDQLLNGDGIDQNLHGFHELDGIGQQTYAADATPQDQIVAVLAGAASVANDGQSVADSIVISATDWWTSFLSLTTSGGDFVFRPGQPVTSFFGLRPIVTTRQTSGRFLVGALQQHAVLFARPSVEVAVSWQHADFAARDQTMIRATSTADLAVLRPAAFCEITQAS